MRACRKALKLSYFLRSSTSYSSARTLLVPTYIGRAFYVRNYVSTLTQNRVLEFIASLEESERQMLIDTLKKFEAENVKFEVQDGATTTALRWRSEFGRPSKITRISANEADEKDEAVQKPTQREMIKLMKNMKL